MRDTHPQYTKEQIIAHCKKWLISWNYGDGSINQVLLDSSIEAAIETDRLTYLLEVQKWIDADSEPELWDVIMAADDVDHNHSDPKMWEKLVEKVETAIAANE